MWIFWYSVKYTIMWIISIEHWRICTYKRLKKSACTPGQRIIEQLDAKERMTKFREKRTPEEKTGDRKKDNERKKRGRTPFGKLKAIYPCKKCDTLFKLQYHADKCVCHAVFYITSDAQFDEHVVCSTWLNHLSDIECSTSYHIFCKNICSYFASWDSWNTKSFDLRLYNEFVFKSSWAC